MLDTLENIELRGKDNHVRMVACMNALEQLIQEESKPVPEQPAEQHQTEGVPAETPEGATEGVVAVCSGAGTWLDTFRRDVVVPYAGTGRKRYAFFQYYV